MESERERNWQWLCYLSKYPEKDKRQDMVCTTFLFQFYDLLSWAIYILALCIMQMPINLIFRLVKVKTWIKIAEPSLISVLIKGESLLFQIPTQFLILMLSLGMCIGRKCCALMKAWARVFNAIQIKIFHVTICGNLHSKII